ncbi:unnamed protein product [Rhizoctonia solani]|uniref:Uncharacterized protein n=1 Tax=Rhizoctonia solani TaxID=456999 RepID=A0A8H3AGQ1_9AGAM|nr:unnamed protein product [Rhizoctonia solani]
MSAVAPPIANYDHHFATAADKEALVQFWRSGLEYLAQGITAHHNITRDTRICNLYSHRAPDDAPRPSLDARIAPHKESLEACILALAELAASGLAQSSLSQQTQQSPSLEARVATLEDQMKALQATVQPLDAKLKTASGNLIRVDSRVKTCEEKMNTVATRAEKSHKDLENRIVGLSAQASNPPSTQGAGHDWVNERLELMDEQLQASQEESESLKERLARAETRITVVEATRTRVEAHVTKLALVEGKYGVLQKEFGDVRIKMGNLLALAPEAKALLSVPDQIKQVRQDIQTLTEQQKASSTRLDCLKSDLEVVEQKLEETNNENPTSHPMAVAVSELDPLKQYVRALIKLPATVDRLQASVAELAPLKLRSQDLTAVAAQAPQLLGLISHNERVQDNINQIQSKLAQHAKDMADAKKETAETTRSLNEQMAALSSMNQTIQADLSGATSQVAQLALDVKRAEGESKEVFGQLGGIDARFKANQVTAQWAQEQIRTMRTDITYLEPLKAQREALLLLSGRTEELMPLSMQFGSSEFQKILKKGERADATMDALKKLTAKMVAVCKDVQQRLGQVEPHVTQLESDVSSALEKLMDLQRASNTTDLLAKDTNESLQRIQNDITPLLRSKPDILNLVGTLAPHRTSAEYINQVQVLAANIQALQKVHASDIAPMKGEVQKIKSISMGLNALQTDMSNVKGKIEPLLALQQQLQVYQDNLEKLQQRIAKLEPDAPNSTGQLTIRVPPTNRGGGFSLSQSLNAGPSNPGPTRWRASTTASPKKSSSAPQPETQSQPSVTSPPPVTQSQSQRPLSGPSGLNQLAEVADELVALIEKSRQTEAELANLSRSFNRFEKRSGELDDSVHGLDQLMTTVQKTSDDNQATLKLLEREFQNLKEDNTAKLKEVDLKQAHINVMKNELQSLKLDMGAKLTAMEANVQANAHELAPLKEHAETLIALARPALSPVSPAPHASATPPESRLTTLEQSARSATKELINLNGWTQRVHADIRTCLSMGNDIKALEDRVQELAGSVETMNPLAASLTERASDLLGLLERSADQRTSDQSIHLTPEQLEGVARVATRLQTLEEQTHTLRTSQPKLKEDLQLVTSQMEDLVPTINKVVKPFTDHVNSILSLLPLSNHVPSLVPLIDQVPQLHASIQSLSDRVDAAASAAAAAAQTPADPSPASQLRSPVTDRELSPAEEPTDNAALFVSATEPRPKKRRRTEEMLESFESQLDSMQGELDGVADDVKVLCAERSKAKKMRTEKQSEGVEVVEPHTKITEDLDMIMDTLRSLFEGEGVWPERIDLILGRQWTRALQSSQLESGTGASSTIAKLCEELEVLKTVVEAYGSGTAAPPSAIDAVHVAWAENLTEKVMANVNKEQAQFKTELEELIGKALQPMKKVFKVFKETPDI